MAMFLKEFKWKKPSQKIVKEGMRAAEEFLMFRVSQEGPKTAEFTDWIQNQEKIFRRFYNQASRAIGCPFSETRVFPEHGIPAR